VTFPADLDVSGRAVLVCGGGPAALGPVRALLEAGALVQVASPELSTTIADLAQRGLLRHLAHAAADEDFTAVQLAVAATGNPEQDREVRRRAARHRVLVTAAGPDGVARPAEAGSVTLVGGGPGDPGLLTVAGLEAVRLADVLVCDRLAPLATLRDARPDAEVVDVSKIPRGDFTPQERINELLISHARAGKAVVRLKGGDSFVFGRGGEEWQACAAAGIPVRVIPGVSSATAAPALAGIPLTHRTMTQGFLVLSGHLPPGAAGSSVDWDAVARAGVTVVILMGLATLPAITAELLRRGMAAGTPAATIADAGLPSQRRIRGTLADIAEGTLGAGLKPPAVTVIGAVAAFPDIIGESVAGYSRSNPPR
jgi:uroporphyrin-III C-methyltransferase